MQGVKLREGEGSRHLGGRIYFGTDMIAHQPTVTFCKLHWSTDVDANPKKAQERLLNPGQSLQLETTVGMFQLALTKVAKDSDGEYCLVDLIRAR